MNKGVGMSSLTTRLHLNELPFEPAERILGPLVAAAQTTNRYPEWDGITLRTALAQHLDTDIDADWVIVGGNGSIRHGRNCLWLAVVRGVRNRCKSVAYAGSPRYFKR